MSGRHSTDLYFEAHVTTDPVAAGEKLALLKEVAGKFSFRVANLVLLKTGEYADGDAFMTGRGQDYIALEIRTRLLVSALRDAGFVVRRYKIENTLLDVRPPAPPKPPEREMVMTLSFRDKAPRGGDEESFT